MGIWFSSEIGYEPRAYRIAPSLERGRGDAFVGPDVAVARVAPDARLEHRWLTFASVPGGGIGLPDDPFVEALGLVARGETLVVGPGLPEPRRIRRMDLVDEEQFAVGAKSELVLRIGEDQSGPCRDLTSARKDGQSGLLYAIPEPRLDQAALGDLGAGERFVVGSHL